MFRIELYEKNLILIHTIIKMVYMPTYIIYLLKTSDSYCKSSPTKNKFDIKNNSVILNLSIYNQIAKVKIRL